MAVQHWYSSYGDNYRDGSYNSGSHMVGWDSRLVRAEVYSFTTGDWPVSHLNWWGPGTSLYQGSNIAIRYAISTSKTAYVNSYGSDVGYALNKNADNDIDVALSPHTTYYITFFPGIDRSSGWGLLNIGTDYPGDNFSIYATEVDYTPCTAPTSLSLSRSIQTPGQNVTLSWSGAKAGVNLTIGSYDIYRSTSSGGTYSYLGNTTSTSYNVAAPSAGQYYYYKIITKPAGSHDAYKSGYSAASSGLKGNTAPGAPSVSMNRTIVPSYGGAVTFTVSPGSDVDGQSLSLAYSTSASGSKISFTSPLTINFTSGATYYFYTYDGLAYSSATSKAVTINTKPVISNATYNSVSLYNAWGGTGITGSQLGYASSIVPKISTNKTGKVTVELEYYSLPTSSPDSTAAWNPTTISRATLLQTSITSTSNVVLSNCNIHPYVALGSTNIHWRLRFILNDGIENSDYNYYPASSGGTYYSIARPSSLLASYNQHANSNISGTIAGQVWRSVRLKVYNDTSVPLVSVVAIVSGAAISSTVVTSVDGQYRYIDITLPDGIASEASINITAQMRDTNSSIYKTVSASVTETKIPTLGTLTHGAQTIAPFTETGSFSISTGWPFGSYTTLDATTLAAYNCNTTATNVIKLIHSSSNSGSGTDRVVKTLTWSKSGDNITTSMNRQSVYDWNHSLGITTYSGSRTYYCKVEITNLFGKVISTPWLSRTFNFAEPAQSPTISSIDWSTDGTTWHSLGSSAIQEGVYLRFNCSFGLYTTDEVRVAILLKNSSGERSISCYESGSPTHITPITYLSTELTRATNRTVATNTKSYIYQVTTEIADTANRQWRINIQNSGYDVYSSYKTTPVVRQCAPTLTFTRCETNASYQLTYAYTLTDNGGGTLTNYLSDGTQNLTTALSSASGTVQSLITGWETKSVSVKTVSVVTGLYTNTKTYYSNAIIVYRISPTVAYRKNQIGVNTDSPTAAAILDIHQSTGRETVLIQGVNSDATPTKFEINVATGQIKFYLNGTLKNTIDLSKGILT